MKQFWFQIVALLLLTVIAMVVYFNPQINNSIFGNLVPSNNQSSSSQNNTPAEVKTIRILDAVDNKVKAELSVEIADDKGERALGLSNRDSLDQNAGMLFIFATPDKYKFWMKGMRFPLDFVWINGDRVIDLLPNVQPVPGVADQAIPVYGPVAPINRLLEVNAGFITSHNIRVGDKLEVNQ